MYMLSINLGRHCS